MDHVDSVRRLAFSGANGYCGSDLKAEAQAELNLARSAERINTGPDSHTIYVVPLRSRAVDLADSSSQQPVHHVARQIKIDEIE